MTATAQAPNAPEAVEAIAAVVSEEESKVVAVTQAVHATVAAAMSLQVRNASEAAHATEVLTRIAQEKKRSEEARTFLVAPLNTHVKRVNARFKEAIAPLEQADEIVRGKVLDYQREQERIRREEEARLEAERQERERQAQEERRRQEAEARAQREAAAREAAAAEAEARRVAAEQERARQQQRDELAQQTADMTDEELQQRRVALEGDSTAPEAIAVARELGRRRDAREAQERAEAARAAEEAARQAEEAARQAPVQEIPRAVLAPAAPLRSTSGSVATRKVWKAEIVDETKVPRAYLTIDMKAINAAMRDGIRDIPGVQIHQVDELAVKAAA